MRVRSVGVRRVRASRKVKCGFSEQNWVYYDRDKEALPVVEVQQIPIENHYCNRVVNKEQCNHVNSAVSYIHVWIYICIYCAIYID